MIAEASDAIHDAMAAEVERLAERWRLNAILAETDRLIWLLEEMNLNGIRTIGEELATTVQEACVAASGHSGWSLRRRTQEALDDILEAQDPLLRRRCAVT